MLSGGWSPTVSDRDTVKQVERKKKMMIEEMLKILTENPEFRETFNELANARKAYENHQ